MFDKFKDLSKKQKRDLKKLFLAAGLLILGVVFKGYKYFSLGALLIAYLIAGLDVLKLSAYNIKNGQVFDENFLMSIATLGAIGLGDYSEAVFVMIFYKTGEFFEDLAVGKSRKSIQSLLEYAPDEVRVLRDGEEEIVDPDEVEIGEIISVLPGEKIALDGEVTNGSSSLNLAFLTGESLPVDVEIGDQVHSGAINLSGHLEIKVSKTFDDSTVSKILELIEESSEKKSVLENFINRFSRYYTPIVVFSALFLGLVFPLIIGDAFGPWIKRALIFLVVSCPCALVLSVPLAFFAGVGKASREGILVKGSNYLEALARVETMVFDKTGTLTEGNFSIIEENSYSDDFDFKILAGSLESYSNHPIADSIRLKYGSDLKDEISDVKEVHGKGLVGTYKDKVLAVGNEKLLADYNIEAPETKNIGTKVYVAYDGKLLGSLVIADVIKDHSKEALSSLKDEGIKSLVLLTGDKDEVADQVGNYLGIDKIYSQLLPDDKLKILEDLLDKEGKSMVAFVGDGINDAPSIVRADVGIAMGALGTDAAIEAADIVLMDDNLNKLPRAIKIARQTLGTARFNVIFSLAVKILVLILSVFGLATMWMAIFADVGVMLIAVLNSMRLMKN